MRTTRNNLEAPARAVTGRSLRWQFGAALLVAGLLPALGLAIIHAVNEYRSQQRVLRERLEVLANTTSRSIDEFISAHQAGVALAANLHEPSRPWGDTLDQLRARYPAFDASLATDADGLILATNPQVPLHGDHVTDRDYFSTPAKTGLSYVSNAFRARLISKHPVIAVSAPITRDGMFAGVVQGSIRVDAFTQHRTRAMKGRGIELLLLDRNSRVIHSSEALPYRFLDSALSSDPHKDLCDLSEKARLLRGILRNGGDAWSACARLDSGWKVVLLSPDSALLSAAGSRFVGLLGVLALSLLGVLVAFVWQMRSLRAGMLSMSASLHALVSKEKDAVIDSPLPQEFLPLAQRISSLAVELEDANRELVKSLAEQRALAQSLSDTVGSREQEIEERTAELTAANAELDRVNRADPLTGCLNRRGMQHYLAGIADGHGMLVHPVRAIAIDVDYFKAYNDLHGHAAGDNALLAVASAAMAVVESYGGCLARMGGEEFLALVPVPVENPPGAEAESIRRAVETLAIRHAAGPAGIVTISVGVAEGAKGDDWAHMLMAADEALYQAKSRGRNRVAVYMD